MDRHSLRRIGAFGIAAIIGIGTALVTAGPAVAAKRVAAGTYTATFPATATTLTLAITNATGSTKSGSWAMSNNDAGVWVLQGTTVAFEVSWSEVGHADELLIGKLTATGIGPGALLVPGQAPQTWSATRTAAAAPSAVAHVATAAGAPKHAATAIGGYTAQLPGFTDTLTLAKVKGAKKAGTFAFTNLGDSGNWLMLGKKIVMSVAHGDDEGILLLGTTTATSISTAAAPGVYYQFAHGTYPWYATKNAP